MERQIQEGRGEEACFCSGFPSPRSSPHSFLAGRGRKAPSFETVSARCPYQSHGEWIFARPHSICVNLCLSVVNDRVNHRWTRMDTDGKPCLGRPKVCAEPACRTTP